MLLLVRNDPYTSCVATTSHHHGVAGVVLDNFSDLSSCDVDDHGVVDTSVSCRPSNGSCVVCYQVRNSLDTSANPFHLTQFVASFISSNTVAHKATFDIVQESEELS